MNDALPDRPITWQEALLAAVLGLILPGAGFVLAALAAVMAIRADQIKIAVGMVFVMAWNIALIVILLSVA